MMLIARLKKNHVLERIKGRPNDMLTSEGQFHL